jgi:hypothetical protein
MFGNGKTTTRLACVCAPACSADGIDNGFAPSVDVDIRTCIKASAARSAAWLDGRHRGEFELLQIAPAFEQATGVGPRSPAA